MQHVLQNKFVLIYNDFHLNITYLRVEVLFFVCIEKERKRFSEIYTWPVSFHFPMQTKKVYFNPNTYAKVTKLEDQGPCTGHRSIIAILHCFSLHEKYPN